VKGITPEAVWATEPVAALAIIAAIASIRRGTMVLSCV
jgi:hypothetical protein